MRGPSEELGLSAEHFRRQQRSRLIRQLNGEACIMVGPGLLILSLAVPVGTPPSPDQSCLEPAMTVAHLSLAYDRWPAPSKSDRKPFELLQKFMRTQSDADHGRAFNAYHFPPGNQDESEDPHLRLALGLLNTSGPDLDFDGADGYRHSRSRYNTNAERIGARQLERLLEDDPSQWLAAVALTRIAIGSRGEDRLKQAEWAVQRVLAHDSTIVAARLAWHDLLVAQGRYADAVRYMKTVSSGCAAVQHARAESIMLTGDTVLGPRMYIAALTNAGADELDRFYEDMLVMASRAELAEYDAVEPGQKPAWLRSFWDRNAAQYGRSLETRIADHTVRTAYADAHLKRDRVQTVAGAGPLFSKPTAFIDDFIPDSSQAYPWDIRGVLYVRHGAPLHRLQLKDACSGQELWVYVADSASYVLEFRRDCGPHDWKLRRKPVCGTPALDPEPVGKGERIITDFAGRAPTIEEAMQKALTTPDAMEVREMYVIAARYDPLYAELVSSCNVGAADTLKREHLRLAISLARQKLARELEWSNSAHRQFLNPLRMAVSAYVFRDAGAAPEVAVLSWVPLADLPQKAKLRYSYSFITPQGDPIRADDVLDVPPQSTTAGVAQSAYLWKPGPASAATIHVQAMTPADTMYGASRTRKIVIPTARPGTLSVSDIVVALPGENGPLVRGASSIAPLPDHNIRERESFRMFFELYGLQAGDEYTTVVRMKRTDRAGVSELRKLFPGRADERTVSTSATANVDGRGIAVHDVSIASDLLPGSYDLEVKVTSARGNATARTTLRVDVANPAGQQR